MSETDADPPRKRTPIPKMQLFILLAIQFAEPIAALVIYPFVVQFVRDTGITKGDETKIGFYAGMLESSFFLAESVTVFQFGRLSDVYGRRPVLLFAPLGLALSMFGFGLSSNYWSMLGWRCLQGVWNGNTGVTKTAMNEISDPSNIADMFSFLPLMWSTGVTLGPALGGILVNPATKWPNSPLGRIQLLKTYPYFLPCAVAGLIALAAFILAWVGLKETLPSALTRQSKGSPPTETSPLLPSATDPEDIRLPVRQLLTRPVVITFVNHGFLTFCEMSYAALLPIVYATPIQHGGLGLSPYAIGLLMGSTGMLNAVIQATLGGRVIRYFGARTMFTTGFVAITAAILFYPILNFLARRQGAVDWAVGLAIAGQLSCSVFTYFAFSVTSLFILAASPNRANVGAVSGISGTVGTAMRAVAPTVASSLFALSVKHQWLSGSAGFLLLASLSIIAVRLTRMLPKEPGGDVKKPAPAPVAASG
ncbi:MFS domain-containing protein [Mycena indigotica]|uniref:MFS domain-containing protein n=1 Tax=Mycena indigotica TaxID=2126181 RepID=A0A8H6STI3_9AGAR|nr:MFS domain-containing protein [Mycena indigotica]KAF7304092.1 MFS domain-containing protein [Mycena indigotica]